MAESNAPFADPDGAVDNDYDDAEIDPEEQLRESVADKVREIKGGDIAIDLINQRPVFVVRRSARSVVEHFDREGWNILEYKHNPYLALSLDDPVYSCVYIPTKPTDVMHGHGGSSTGQTYDIPRGRLLRVPIELMTSNGMRTQDDRIAALLAAMIANADEDGTGERKSIIRVATATFDREVVDDAKERAALR